MLSVLLVCRLSSWSRETRVRGIGVRVPIFRPISVQLLSLNIMRPKGTLGS